MQQAIEGSLAIARAVALCKPQVVAAYPITPQTHIVENIAKLVADGVLDCNLVSVESEFSAASVVLGAAAAGSRTYTASASQGILLMCEVLYNIAGLRIPTVLTCANRAVSAPLSIWNDQQDSMAVRDAGWIQLYCADNQEAVDTTIQAFRIAERCEIPVMVCVDGFTLTHTLEPIEIPEAEQVNTFLPPYKFSRSLNPQQPISIGTLLSPDLFPEARHSHHQALLNAEQEIISAANDWAQICGRAGPDLLEANGPDEARIGILIMGSVYGTLADARNHYSDLEPIRLIKLRAFRPFPVKALQEACQGLDKIIVLDRALSPGSGGILGNEVRSALYEIENAPQVYNFAIGLGGRDVPMDTLPQLISAIRNNTHEYFRVFDAVMERLPEEDR
ncbi:MAG: pyruvate ferredoxin oxidoreductase [Gammaproteobacteria bacterium]|nr:pyruvate ferredoxin oxidoreductase [Gammaproteobacteria bacterium]